MNVPYGISSLAEGILSSDPADALPFASCAVVFFGFFLYEQPQFGHENNVTLVANSSNRVVYIYWF